MRYLKLAILGVLVCAIIAGYLLRSQRPVGPVLPVPNGYDDLLKAAQLAVSDRHLGYGEASDEELKDLVNRNREALDLARAGCAHECGVTTDYKLSLAAYSAQHLPVLGQIKKLALAFRAEGELAERVGRTNDAARVYVDGIRFGQEVCRGGLLIDRLVGIACEGITLAPLIALVQDLDGRTCKELARLLEQMDASREPMQVTWDQEQTWALRAGSIVERIRNRIGLLVSGRMLQNVRQKSGLKVGQIQLQERDLLLRLAAQAYRLEHGKSLGRTGDLAPEYLKSVPRHPVTGLEMTLGE